MGMAQGALNDIVLSKIASAALSSLRDYTNVVVMAGLAQGGMMP
jgi:hypothetical protein